MDLFGDRLPAGAIDIIAGIEPRGYMLGAPLALRLGVGFVPVRKTGAPIEMTFGRYLEVEFALSKVEIRERAVVCGRRVLVVDDLLAYGGDAASTGLLLESLG